MSREGKFTDQPCCGNVSRRSEMVVMKEADMAGIRLTKRDVLR
jgi:hypothetical protein